MTTAAVEDLLRELTPQVVGTVARRYGDFDAAEDAVQEALLAAATHWPVDGVPDSPRGWLIQTAGRKLIDQVRSEQARRRREKLVDQQPPAGDVTAHDDTLTLLFMCCHPVLTPPSAIALTLRAVGGLTTGQIARAFLVPETTMGQRISRAKQRITAAGARFELPADDEREQRLPPVLHVLYLIFNEGYTSTDGTDLYRTDLSAEAIRLARTVRTLLPDDPEVAGLLALMLLTDARRPARTGPAGELVPLAEQDRSRWDRTLVNEGIGLLVQGMSRGPAGTYQLEAAIAAVHDLAERPEDTDWPRILGLYNLLEQRTGNPMVGLNRAVATAMVHGSDAGLDQLDALGDRLGDHYRLAAVRAHLLAMRGDHASAAEQYRAAAARTANAQEKQYLVTEAARLTKN